MSGPMREERKVVTALFADVVGSTQLTERLDPEDAREVLGGAVRRMVEAAEAFGGTVKDLAGDGILALFGAPVTHEDDAERAIRAGLRIVADCEAADEPVTVRVGIDTGLVVLGPIGGGGRVEYGATGDALNTASRLQSHAVPGSILVGGATQRAAGDRFAWGEEQRLDLKGKADPVPAFEVLGSAQPPRSEVASTPMVGRELEFERASRIADSALAGAGGALVTVGEPGIGKSRLIEELRRHVEADWLEGRCVSYGATTPYLPLRDVVGDALERSGAELADAAPYLADVLGIGADESSRSPSPETRRLRTLEAIRRVVAGAAARRPTVVAIEDLQWADASTVQALERLVPWCAGLPVLFLFTARDVGEALETLVPGGAEVIELSPLPSDRVDDLLEVLLEGRSIPAELLARVVETSGGNPFFLVELVRSLIASDELGFDVRTAELPNTIEKVILARLDLLEPSTRDMVTAASVLGRTVALPVLERLVGSDPRADADELVRARLFERDGQPDEVSFAHGLIQEVAYRSLLKRRRRELHASAATAIEDLWPDRVEQNLGILAIHHRGAGDSAAALRCHDLAADRAERLHASEEALDHRTASIEIAAELGLTVGDNAERLWSRARLRARTGDNQGAREDLEQILGDAGIHSDIAMRAHDELGSVLAGAADYREAVPHLEAALGIARALGLIDGEVSALSRLSIVSANRLDFDEALNHGQDALRAADASGDERLEAVAMDALKQVALETGDVATLGLLAERLTEIHRRNDDLWLLQFAILEVGFADLEQVRLDRALTAFEESLAINRRIGDVGNEPLYLAMIGRVHRGRAEYEQALTIGRRAHDAAVELRHEEWIAWTALWLGSTLLEVGDVAGALDMLLVGAEAAERASADLHLVRCLGVAARAAQRAGEGDRAADLADRCTAILDRVRVRPPRAYVIGEDAYVGVAHVRLAQGRPDVATALLAPIVAACARCGWSDGVVEGSLVLAEAALARGIVSAAVEAGKTAVTEARRTSLPTAWRAHRGAAEAFRAAGDEHAAVMHDAEAERAFAHLLKGIHDRSLRDTLLSAASGGPS